MCGRYVLAGETSAIADAFEADPVEVPERMEAYNTAPGTFMPVVVANRPGRSAGSTSGSGSGSAPSPSSSLRPNSLRMLRWGLVPIWSKDESRAYSLINARSETLASKPSFRDAFRSRRCVIPANGFYEWEPGRSAPRQPWYVRPVDERHGARSPKPATPGGPEPAEQPGPWMAMAGLYEHWKTPSGAWLSTYTIVTVPAGPDIERLHHRMPALLSSEGMRVWLDPGEQAADRLEAVLRPSPAGSLRAVAVSQEVNNAKHQGAHLIRPVDEN